jgi:acyl-CoA thioester hydrolase
MNEFSRLIQLRWSDLDPNFHVRHSVYYDWGAMVRVEFLTAFGLTTQVMQELQFGPILFREECIFRREIRSGDQVHINLQLARSKKDYSRWTIRHSLTKNEGILCAQLTVDGAWMDITRRKLASPPEKVFEVFGAMPITDEFGWGD